MKRLLFFLLAYCSLGFAQQSNFPYPYPIGIVGKFTVANLPTTGLNNPSLAYATDSNGGSCTSGSSSTLQLCQWNGSAWSAVGGGGTPSGSAGGDLGSTYPNPTVLSVAHVTTGVLAPANGGALNSGTTVGVGGFWAPAGTSVLPAGSLSAGAAGDLTANNVIHWSSFDIYGTQVVGHMAWNITTGDNNSCVMDVGLYSADGQTLKVNTGGVSCNASGNASAAPAQVTLPSGTYIMAWCGNASASINTVAYREFLLSSDGAGTTTALKNINGKRYGTSANACTAGVLPSALGALTAVQNFATSYPPGVWMEP